MLQKCITSFYLHSKLGSLPAIKIQKSIKVFRSWVEELIAFFGQKINNIMSIIKIIEFITKENGFVPGNKNFKLCLSV